MGSEMCIRDSYYDAKLIIAFAGVPVAGNTILKSPFVAVLDPPKSNTTHSLSLLVSLYIAPKAAVKVALENVKSSKSTKDVAPVVTDWFCKTRPVVV